MEEYYNYQKLRSSLVQNYRGNPFITIKAPSKVHEGVKKNVWWSTNIFSHKVSTEIIKEHWFSFFWFSKNACHHFDNLIKRERISLWRSSSNSSRIFRCQLPKLRTARTKKKKKATNKLGTRGKTSVYMNKIFEKFTRTCSLVHVIWNGVLLVVTFLLNLDSWLYIICFCFHLLIKYLVWLDTLVM